VDLLFKLREQADNNDKEAENLRSRLAELFGAKLQEWWMYRKSLHER
jgi:hypothetical protein